MRRRGSGIRAAGAPGLASGSGALAGVEAGQKGGAGRGEGGLLRARPARQPGERVVVEGEQCRVVWCALGTPQLHSVPSLRSSRPLFLFPSSLSSVRTNCHLTIDLVARLRVNDTAASCPAPTCLQRSGPQCHLDTVTRHPAISRPSALCKSETVLPIFCRPTSPATACRTRPLASLSRAGRISIPGPLNVYLPHCCARRAVAA